MNQDLLIGEWIKRRRKALDLSQKKLADLVGCTLITIAKIEAGDRRPSRQLAELLAKHLQVPRSQQEEFIRAARGNLSANNLGTPNPINSSVDFVVNQSNPSVLSTSSHDYVPYGIASDRPMRIQAGRIVGRQEEMAQVRAQWDKVLHGESRVLVISGEPGIGKSRLMAELINEVHENGFLVLMSECYSETSAPYYPIARMLMDITKWPTGLSDLVMADLVSVAPSLQSSFPNIKANPALEPLTEKFRLFESLYTFFAMLSERTPLLIAIDDIHWADRGSLELVGMLARRFFQKNKRILIALTGREAELIEQRELYELMNNLNRTHLSVMLMLARFDLVGTKALLESFFSVEVTDEFCELIYRETQGNPFFVEEVCKDLVENEQVYQVEGRWERREIHEIRVPGNVQIAIQSRINKLPDVTQEILLQAAVLGRRFEFDVLQQVSDKNEAALIEVLEPAIRAQFIHEVGNAGSGSLEFSHSLIRMALNERISGLRRRILHQRAIVALKALHPEQYDVLAYHAHQAGEDQQAVEYYRKAGNRAMHVYTHQDALRFYTSALELAPEDSTETCELYLARAKLYDLRGERDFQFQDLILTEALARQLGNQELQARATLMLGEYKIEISDYPGAVDMAQQTLTLAVQAGVQDLQAQAYMLWGRVLTFMSDLQVARERLTQAFELSKSAGLPLTETRCLVNIGILDYRLGELGNAERELKEALDRSRAIEERRIEAAILINLGNIYWMDGDLDQSLAAYNQSLEICRQIGDRLNEARALSNIGSIMTEQYSIMEALPNLELALTITRELGQRSDESIVLGHLGDAHLALGRYTHAQDYREQALSIVREVGDRQGEAELTAGLSRISLLTGNFQQAQEQAKQAIELARAIGGRQEEALAWSGLGDALTASEDWAGAVEAFQYALASYDDMQQHSKSVEMHAALARLAELRGDHRLAMTHLAVTLNTLSDDMQSRNENLKICLACYEVLRNEDPPVAQKALLQGYTILQMAAESIKDQNVRHQYFQNIPDHRALIQAWEKHNLG